MRHAHKLAFAFFLLTVAAVDGRAHAQTAAQATTTDSAGTRADDLAHKGNELALKDKWVEAEALFKQAWALKQSYDIGGNLGIAELELGKHRDAAEHLSFALAHFPANGKAEHRDLLREKLAKARTKVSACVIDVSATGADVLIDGTSIGSAPLQGEVFLTPGTRTVEARLAGYDTAKRTIDVAAGGSDRIALTLRRSGPGDTPPPWRPGPALIVPAAVVALGGLVTGIGLTVAANGKGADRTALLAKVGESGCAQPPSASATDCATLLNTAKNQSTLRNGAVGAFVVGGGFALVTGALVAWSTIKRPPPRDGMRIQVAPALGATERGVVISGTW